VKEAKKYDDLTKDIDELKKKLSENADEAITL